ncbi:UxaA family hydrolase [Pseudovibrio exalbescens]|uniref:Altronate hydrolase n=1 Tax=Pseudovibrio exalbescens TaxID=197461 RepID=A0A1U7JGB7_9HYPH|nr:altronate dehydratase family protein [Pseudovibrio exalbescens]OKL43796.1 altronate hydrolase [Pseudovibrio exalbescens]
MKTYLKIHSSDSVGVALQDLTAGQSLAGVELKEDILTGHKFALRDIAMGEDVIKYGSSIGKSTQAIAAGSLVHSHNLRTGLGTDEVYSYAGAPEENAPIVNVPQIQAFVRADGDIGIRNDIWIVPLVGCVNGIANNVARQFEASGKLPEGSQITVLSHPYGCSQLGDDLENTRAILRNLVVHPNAGGVLVMGLGCENNTLESFVDGLKVPDPERVRFMVAQAFMNEEEAALEHLEHLSAQMQNDRRELVGIDRLRVGLKCGGSDGFSGITANPLLGAFSDWLCARGGATVLTEVPEMFGAERILMARAENQGVFGDIVKLINDFKQYYVDHDQPIYENPSPGNKQGGITTLEEKSLGCTQKAGTAIVRDVKRYKERIEKRGLTLFESPGNDGTAITALAASGCHMVLFTTGRGNPMGSVVPTVKVASNTALADKKKHWIDFSAGSLVDQETDMDALCDDFVAYLIRVANGEKTRNEISRNQDVVIFKSGVTL